MNPVDVVETQLTAYNACNLDAFAATYADNVHITDDGGKLICDGVKQLREVYGPLFAANPNQAAIIENRIAAGPYVIDAETVIGRADGKTRHAVAIYKVEGSKIVSVVLVRG